MAELKLCPFCGGNAKVVLLYDSYHVECDNPLDCTVIPSTWGYGTEEEAIIAWNRRAGEDG